MEVREIIQEAEKSANEVARKVLIEDKSNSNGSEAWQAVVIDVDGRSTEGRAMKDLGIRKDGYWGYLSSPSGFNNYYAEGAWVKEYARVLNSNGIKARTVERLL